ncbi:MAG: hypothetical protein QXQ15_03085, partial [Candidatus Anstonellales archaeon]
DISPALKFWNVQYNSIIRYIIYDIITTVILRAPKTNPKMVVSIETDMKFIGIATRNLSTGFRLPNLLNMNSRDGRIYNININR